MQKENNLSILRQIGFDETKKKRSICVNRKIFKFPLFLIFLVDVGNQETQKKSEFSF